MTSQMFKILVTNKVIYNVLYTSTNIHGKNEEMRHKNHKNDILRMIMMTINALIHK